MELKKAIFSGNINRSSTGAFGIISFSNAAKTFPPQEKALAQYTNNEDMQKAKDFINMLRPGGGTNMKTAWEAAIKLIKKNNIDTVYFLTDGEPGDGFDPYWLQDTFKKSNLRSGVKIHSIAIGGNGQGLMKKVADLYNGSFVFIP